MAENEIKAKFFPTGFTGFAPSNNNIDPADFKAVCHAAARELGGKVVEIQNAGVTPNFHSALLEWGPERKQVLLQCNRIHPIVAFCLPGDSIQHMYIDVPELAAVLTRISNWLVISKSALESVVDSTVLDLMAPQDRHIVEEAKRRHWFGPTRTVSDIMFHHWD